LTGPRTLGVKPDRAALYADTLQVAATPGVPTTASVILLNQGVGPDHFRINVLGIPSGWVTSSPPIIQLPPGGRQEIRIGITPDKKARKSFGTLSDLSQSNQSGRPGQHSPGRYHPEH